MTPPARTGNDAHLLVVDDDQRLRDLIGRFLLEQGFRVTTAIDAADARKKMQAISFDLLVLDIMMPGESGLDLAHALRREEDVPILLLTAMGEAEDRIRGLESGADDYLAKPFEPRELVLRIQAILKRTGTAPAAGRGRAPKPVRFGPFTFETESRRLYRAGEHVHLTEAEADLLAQLAARPGEAVGREDLSPAGADDAAGSRNIDVLMTRLRRKIEDDARFPRYLQTARGRGYLLQPG